MHERIEELLKRLREGDEEASRALLPLVYAQLYDIASKKMVGQEPGHTLQPTALVHEAYVRMFSGENVNWVDRDHFLRVAATAMRQVLVDSARRRNADKRNPGGQRLEFDAVLAAYEAKSGNLEELNSALERLETRYPDLGQLVEMRFFGGQSMKDCERILGRSDRTVSRMWNTARAFLRTELGHA